MSSYSTSDASWDESEPPTGIIMVSLSESLIAKVLLTTMYIFDPLPNTPVLRAPTPPLETFVDQNTPEGGGGKAMEVDDWCTDGQMGVYFGKDTDNSEGLVVKNESRGLGWGN